MGYQIEIYPEAEEQMAALPAEALPALAEAMVMLELTPWAGDSLNKRNPDAEVRTLPFGRAGMLHYLILEHQRRVDMITVVWVG